MKLSITIIIAALMAACAPAHAGGLAPASSVRPVERPSYAPIVEPYIDTCTWPVYASDGVTVLYWNNDPDCYVEPVDGGASSIEVDTQTEVPTKETVTTKPDEEKQPEDDNCKNKNGLADEGDC